MLDTRHPLLLSGSVNLEPGGLEPRGYGNSRRTKIARPLPWSAWIRFLDELLPVLEVDPYLGRETPAEYDVQPTTYTTISPFSLVLDRTLPLAGSS